MFYSLRNIPIYINGERLLVSEADISQSIGLESVYRIEDRVSEKYLVESPHVGSLNIRYYLTGADPLKKYIYSLSDNTITGNFGGITFNQGYLTAYDLPCEPNRPVQVSARISFFDKVSGQFASVAPVNLTGQILNFSNVSINNLSSYTETPLNVISNARFSYNCQVEPVYKYSDTGAVPTRADRVSVLERTISADIFSDNTSLNIPFSGEKFGIILNLSGEAETFGCSGRISAKNMAISTDSLHTHSISISQNHLNRIGGIASISVSPSNSITITSHADTHPFISNDSSINYVDQITIGETNCTGFTVSRQGNYDQIDIEPNELLLNDYLTIFSTNGNFTWPTPLSFTYNPITVNGISITSGRAGTPLYITGSNFNYVSDVFIGQTRSNFQIISGNLIGTTVPYNGYSGPVTVMSRRRGLTGVSSNTFFHEPKITIHSPVTGFWGDTITIGGNNISGATGIKFGNINANSFSVLSNSIAIAVTPSTGAGYPSGYITIYTSGGSSQSPSRYSPEVPIYSFSPMSGIFGEAVTINTKVDTGYLFPSGDGFKIDFCGVDQKFKVNSTGTLTGVIPIGARDGYIRIYRPDGISTYKPNTGIFNVLGDPEIYSVSGIGVTSFYKNVIFGLSIEGKNLQYFNQTGSYVGISGTATHRMNTFTGASLSYSSNGSLLVVPNMVYLSDFEYGPNEATYIVVKNDYGTVTTPFKTFASPPNQGHNMSVINGSFTTMFGADYNAPSPQSVLDESLYNTAAILCGYNGATYYPPAYFELARLDGGVSNLSSFRFVCGLVYGEGLSPQYPAPNGGPGRFFYCTSFPSGVISLYRGSQMVYNSQEIYIGANNEVLINYDLSRFHSGEVFNLPSLYTGITKIRFSATGVIGNGISDTATQAMCINLAVLQIF